MTNTSGIVLTEQKMTKNFVDLFCTARMYFNKHTRDLVEF